jgi:hypothetical protein
MGKKKGKNKPGKSSAKNTPKNTPKKGTPRRTPGKVHSGWPEEEGTFLRLPPSVFTMKASC